MHNEIQLAILYKEEKNNIFMEILNNNECENNFINYFAIIELFENNNGYYKKVSREKNIFKINKNCNYKTRITIININKNQELKFYE